MNRIGIVIGIAAAVTLAGCKDPDFKHSQTPSQSEVKSAAETDVAATEVKTPPAREEAPVVETKAPKSCTCPAGTKHSKPCECGAADCRCKVVPPEPEYTVYTVQSGDYLAKISKKFNVKIDTIRKLNPSIKKDVVRVGQKLKIPGKFDVPQQTVPAAAPRSAASAKKFAPYTGATVEYTVKSGDTLGKIAYSNGITIRQLKALNGLKSDDLKAGKKLKIPSGKASAAPKKEQEKAPAPAVAAPAEAAPAAAPAEAAPAAAPADAAPAAAPAESAAAAPAASSSETPPAAPLPTHVVEAGEDILGVAVRWNVSPAAIRELNNLAEDAKLVPGMVLKLPPEAAQQQ